MCQGRDQAQEPKLSDELHLALPVAVHGSESPTSQDGDIVTRKIFLTCELCLHTTALSYLAQET